MAEAGATGAGPAGSGSTGSGPAGSEPTESGPAGTGSRESGPTGIWLGVDVGSVRIGVARSDPRAVLAVPVQTIARDARRNTDLAQLAALVSEYEAVGVVVGLPRSMSGTEGPAAVTARSFGAALAVVIAPVSVQYCDERLTTVVAQRSLYASGVRSRAQRAVVDQAAAVQILQSYLDRANQDPLR